MKIITNYIYHNSNYLFLRTFSVQMQKSGNAKHGNYAFERIAKVFRSLYLWLWPLIESKIQQTYSRHSMGKTLTRLPDRKSNLSINNMFCVDFLFFLNLTSEFTNKHFFELHVGLLITYVKIE